MTNFASSKNLNVSSFFIIVLVSLVWDGRRRSSVHQTFFLYMKTILTFSFNRILFFPSVFLFKVYFSAINPA